MSRLKIHGQILCFLVAPALFILDRWTKIYTESVLPVGDSVVVIPSMLHITHVQNHGAAFGMMQGSRYWLISISIFCVAYLIFSMFKASSSRKAGHNLAMSLIIAGALGNLYDRIFLGYVVDFIDFRIWPVFNVADSAITVGVAVLILFVFIDSAVGNKKA